MTGRLWHVADDIDTDQLAPGAWMKYGIDVIAQHCLEHTLPSFASEVRPGDYLVAGHNSGCGSSREQAAGALRHLGVKAVIARSFAGLFYRNAFNLGLLLVQCESAPALQGRAIRAIDPVTGRINTDQGDIGCEPVPHFLLEYVAAGGLLEHLRHRFTTRTARPTADNP